MMRKLAGMALLVAALPLLQACVPLAVTGAAAASLIASDRRTTGTYIEDESIEWKAVGQLRDPKFAGSHVNPTSYNRRVLLTGEAPSEEMKKELERWVRAVPSVKEVVNEVQVAGATSLASRGSDALVTSNVKARMVNNGKFSPSHVKVLTEAGVVYLMGLVTPAEGEAAAEVARTTGGVNRVVKVFEYVN
jgi:osmotically-inducible protein OsmY